MSVEYLAQNQAKSLPATLFVMFTVAVLCLMMANGSSLYSQLSKTAERLHRE